MDTIYAEGFGYVDDFAMPPRCTPPAWLAEADIAKVLGRNFLRVFASVWDKGEDA
jgi:hypothetical protein